MESIQLEEHLQEFLAKRVLARSEGKNTGSADEAVFSEVGFPNSEVPDFAKVEKNLVSIGFFTPSKKKIKSLKKKRISFARVIDGKRVEVSATILPSAEYGLPTTADQDKYLAFQKLVTEIKLRDGVVKNPVGFTSRQLLRLLGIETAGGKVYDEIVDWLKRMTLTGISSEGVVYFAGHKSWATDTFHVFTRAVAVGREMPDGSKADRHYVWLSEWQLENINFNHLLSVDLDAYRRLRNHIAKALVPILQIWLYASRRDGLFEKRYEELCEILSTHPYTAVSRIHEQLRPALNELVKHDYISRWEITRTADLSGFKVLLVHGEKFYRDQSLRQGAGEVPQLKSASESQTEANVPVTEEDNLIRELIRRGISERRARQVLQESGSGPDVLDQLEWADFLIEEGNRGKGKKKYNPTGFYIHILAEKIQPPEDFETAKKRQDREARKQAVLQEQDALAERGRAYERYVQEVVSQHLKGLSKDEYAKLVENEKKAVERNYPAAHWKNVKYLEMLAEQQLRARLKRELPMMTFDEFERQSGGNLLLPFDEKAS